MRESRPDADAWATEGCIVRLAVPCRYVLGKPVDSVFVGEKRAVGVAGISDKCGLQIRFIYW